MLTVAVAIAITLCFVANDSWFRYQRILNSTRGTAGSPEPSTDANSPTGYQMGMRKLVLPAVGADGLHWIMHTQNLLEGGGWRIRFTSNDNVPLGREVHWSHGFIWWLIVVGYFHAAISGLPLPAAIEAVAPYANTLIYFLLITALPWLLFRRFGAIASASFAISMGCTFTFYEFFMIGNVDHHGLAAASALTCALLLVSGGGGWVSSTETSTLHSAPLVKKSSAESFEFEIKAADAKKHFIASGLAGSISLWVSAATMIPTLVGIAMGSLISAYFFGRQSRGSVVYYQPMLWRWWAISGCAGSLSFYLIEYFPFHMGMRMEVNHPLYAAAWLGGGEILARLARWRLDAILPWTGANAIPILIACLIAVFSLPSLIMLSPNRYFWVSDGFLWELHQNYIHEFQSIFTWAQTRSRLTSVVNLFTFPFFGLIVIRLLLLRELGRSWRGMLTLVAFPALFITCLGMFQIRWLGIANALWLPVIPTCLCLLFHKGFGHTFTLVEKVAAGTITSVALLTFPQNSLRYTIPAVGQEIALSRDEFLGRFIRDVSHSIRRANPDRELVVASGPMTTSQMMFFGGMKGMGTLYWENMGGLKAAASLFAARTESEALDLVKQHRITHIAAFSNDLFAFEYVRLLGPLPFGDQSNDAFIPSLINGAALPQWLRPIHFQPPVGMTSDWVMMLEVLPNQTPAESHIGIADFLEKSNDFVGAINHFQKALTLTPENDEIALRLGALMLIYGDDKQAMELLDRGLKKVSPTKKADLCNTLARQAFLAKRHHQAAVLLCRSLEASPQEPVATNALAWILATSFDDSVRKPEEALSLAEANTVMPDRITYLVTLAAAFAENRRFSDAIATIQQAIHSLGEPITDSKTSMVNSLREQLRSYEAGKPLRFGGQ